MLSFFTEGDHNTCEKGKGNPFMHSSLSLFLISFAWRNLLDYLSFLVYWKNTLNMSKYNKKSPFYFMFIKLKWPHQIKFGCKINEKPSQHLSYCGLCSMYEGYCSLALQLKNVVQGLGQNIVLFRYAALSFSSECISDKNMIPSQGVFY